MPMISATELVVAGMAGAIYLWIAALLRRVLMKRRRQRARRDARFVAHLLAGVGNGSVRSLPDAAGLFRTHFSLSGGDEIDYGRLGNLMFCASRRDLRRCMSQARSSSTSREDCAEIRPVLRQLEEQVDSIRFDAIDRGLSPEQRERIRADIEATVERRLQEAREPSMSLWSQKTRRRIAGWGRVIFTGASGVIFIWVTLTTWNAWK